MRSTGFGNNVQESGQRKKGILSHFYGLYRPSARQHAECHHLDGALRGKGRIATFAIVVAELLQGVRSPKPEKTLREALEPWRVISIDRDSFLDFPFVATVDPRFDLAQVV